MLRLTTLLVLAAATGCASDALPPREVVMNRSGLVRPDGSTLPVFADDFNRSGALGAEWEVIGTASANGSAATLTSALTYAAWTGAPTQNASVSASLGTPTSRTSLGVFTRASEIDPDRNH